MEIMKKRLIDDIVLINDLDSDKAQKLEVFSIEQLHVIEEMLMYDFDMIDFFAFHTFNPDQMYEIFDGAKLDVDFTLYMDEELNYLQMRVIKYGLQMGIDTSKYNDFRFSWDQMYQIYWGLVDNIDVSEYADYNLSVFEMIRLRKQLTNAA